MRVETVRSVAHVERSAWNAIVGRNSLICTHEYMSAVEASRINDCRFFYPVVYDGDEVLAHACVYFISTALDSFAQGFPKQLSGWARRLWSRFLIMRTVECGTPVALGNTISFREGVDKETILLQIVRETECLARGLGVSVVLFRDFREEELDEYDFLLRDEYTRIRNLPSARLEIRWNTFDEYLNSMRSRYRRKMMSQLKKFEESGGVREFVLDFSPFVADMARLWKNAYDHASEYRREVLDQVFFENISVYLEGRSAVIAARIDGRLVGFSLLLFDDSTLIPLFCGLEYSYNEDCGVYFNLLYEVVRVGIREGMKEIDFGITTLDPKVDLGAKVVPLHMYLKHLNPLLNKAVPRMFEIMTPRSPACSRRVFKS